MTFRLLRTLLTAALLANAATALAQPIVLKVHHYLPPYSLAQKKLIEPWCEKVGAESGGRLSCQIFPAMQLGGSPPQLFDQAKDGVADIVWTLPGYQAGRFLVSEAFELPFATMSAERSSRALWRYVEQYGKAEFAGVRPILLHVNDGFLVHTTNRQIRTLADFKGLKLRGATRQNSRLIAALGATPVSMPMPQVPESMSKGVIDGAFLPWEIIPSLKIQEITKFHSDVDPSLPRLANTVFAFVMNPAKYASLPDDLKKVIDANSGEQMSAWAGKVFDAATPAARDVAQAQKNSFYTIPAEEVARWQKLGQSVSDSWVKEVTAKGHDGARLLEAVRASLKQ